MTCRIYVLVVSILLCISHVLGQSLPSVADNITSVIHVSGMGSASVEQDTVDITLAVQSQAFTAMEAQSATNSNANNVMSSLERYNVTNLKTESISLQPMYNYTSSPSKIVGFESIYVISYSVSPESAGQTLDTAVRMGADRIDSVNVSSSPEKQNAAYEEALKKATNDAASKANVVAQSLGVCIKQPLYVNVESTEPPIVPIFSYMGGTPTMSAESSSPTVVPGETDVHATVAISYLHGSC